VELSQKYPNVYFDTAQGFSSTDAVPHHPHRGLAEDDAVRLIRKIGIKRIMFGTDFPGVAWQPQVEQILRLPLTDQERRLILAENAKNILKV
jgi:predicted TIM-barrel fold metal-dependent hydrolase